MAKRKTVEIRVLLKDGVSGTLKKISSSFKKMTSGIKNSLSGIPGLVKAAFVAAPILAFGKAIKKAFDFETARVQLKTLLGSMDAAKKRFNELREFSANTPFQLPDLLKASRLLTTFSEGALGSAKSLQAIGDAAAGVNENIADVSFWIGRAYSMLKGGKPFGEAAMRLQEMGILTARGRAEMEALQASGASFEVVWARLQKELMRFEGGMKALAQTGNGLISTLKDNWTIAVATFGEAFMDAAKGGISEMISILQRLVKDGTITEWANQAKAALDSVVQVIKLISKGGDARSEVLGAVGQVLKEAFKTAVVSALELFMKYAPIIGQSIGKGLVDLIPGLNLMPKDIREKKSDAAGLRESALMAYRKSQDYRSSDAEKEAATKEYYRLQAQQWKLESEIKEMVKAWNEGRVDIEQADLPGSLENLSKVIDKHAVKVDDASKALTHESGHSARKLEAEVTKAIEKGVENGAAKGIASGVTQKSLSGGLDGRDLSGSAGFVKQLTRGQEALTKKQALAVTNELIKSGGAGQLGAAGSVMDELMKGQTGLSQKDALGVVRQLIKDGSLGDGTAMTDLIKQLSMGQDKMSKGEIAKSLMGMDDAELSPSEAMGGVGVSAPSTESQLAIANGYLKEIATNTAGGLF